MHAIITYLKEHPGIPLNKTLSFKDIRKIPSEYREEINNIKKRIYILTNWLPKGYTLPSRMKYLIHNLTIDSGVCGVCGLPLKYNNSKSRFMTTCGCKDKKHVKYRHKMAEESRKKTFLKKYGKTSYTSTTNFKNKSRNTILRKYGVTNVFADKDIQKKIRKTTLDKFKTPFWNQSNTKLDISFNPLYYKDNFNHIDLPQIKIDYECSSDTVYRYLRQNKVNYTRRSGSSNAEREIVSYIKNLDPDMKIILNSRKIIPPKELDIYLPEYNLAIEYNGLMFHSQGSSNYNIFNTPNKDKNIHLSKTEACEAKGIQLLHINEDEWTNTRLCDIWKSVIRNKIHKNENRIGARNCQFATKEQLLESSKAFLEDNHLQGAGAIGPLRYGLIYEGKLVALMTFSKSRFNGEDYELVRFAVKKNWSVMGAASKLLKEFRKEHIGSIVSYANRRWSDGRLYKSIGFNLLHKSAPNYFYFKPGQFKLRSRNVFQKHKLINKLKKFDPLLTEKQNMFNNDYRRIYDSGNYVFNLD